MTLPLAHMKFTIMFLKHLPDNSLLVLLDIFNGIWENGNFPAAWREATIIPIAKPGKDPTNATTTALFLSLVV
ncbi:hypothetical protein HOLleu_13527 [Holothuria leucospilota]|uniref:Uncharacterized protein n=1 Tax=Holothuria leucospilota TaxID=206669 RepID=A0A9Q1HDS0_HOLLE|nr:hypothetical protein HOLleu_13527 [Holothuria leucospilota]